jgi:transposase-like protein
MNIQLKINSLSHEQAFQITKTLRDKLGVTCRKCESKSHYWCESIQMYQCRNCNFRTSLKNGTAMQSSKLSIKAWLMAIYYIAKSAKSITAMRMQDLLEIGSYETAHRLMHKIRNSMSQREIESVSEFLDGYFQTIHNVGSREKIKKGMCNYILLRNYRDENGKYQVSMISVPDLQKYKPNRNSAISMARSHDWNREIVESKAVIHKDELSYWHRIFLRNLRRNIDGIHHGVLPKYRQQYIDEFCFRTNMRMSKKNVFEELLTRVLLKPWWA